MTETPDSIRIVCEANYSFQRIEDSNGTTQSIGKWDERVIPFTTAERILTITREELEKLFGTTENSQALRTLLNNRQERIEELNVENDRLTDQLGRRAAENGNQADTIRDLKAKLAEAEKSLAELKQLPARLAWDKDERIKAWDRIVWHPIFRPCFSQPEPLIDSMMKKLDELAKMENDRAKRATEPVVSAPVADDREALLKILAGMDYEGGGMMRWHPSGEPSEVAHRVATTILAAGFRRQPVAPEIVTTEEELEALPNGIVVRSEAGTIACRYDRGFGVVFGDERPFSWTKLALPATVLYRPVVQEEGN